MLDDETGHTLFTRARNLEQVLGVRRLFLKFEGSNPTGTQKDRIARIHYEDAHEKGFNTITVATCGNFGASIAWACSHNGIRPTVFIPNDYHTIRVKEMERLGATVLRVDGGYEEAVAASRQAAKENGWYDANPGDNNYDLAKRGYGRIAHEIYADLGRMPDTVSVACGNGTTLAGIYDGFKEVALEHGIDRVPRMIAASTPRGNPVIKSWKQGLKTCVDLKPEEVKETSVNEPLTNWHSFDGQRALDAIYQSNGFAAYASDTEMRKMTMLTRNMEGINVMTASTAALAGLGKIAKRTPDLGETHVAVLTGRSFSRPAGNLDQFVARRVGG
ncbi:MAG TPA: pyridoxal-phosphate dependent enzyme [Candidatus Thermoplasmatota archaeon]|nr:pyridoxal-phosphate dependent enzyme [Candidatus Thermoplasmatota archaeon]